MADAGRVVGCVEGDRLIRPRSKLRDRGLDGTYFSVFELPFPFGLVASKYDVYLLDPSGEMLLRAAALSVLGVV